MPFQMKKLEADLDIRRQCLESEKETKIDVLFVGQSEHVGFR